MHLSSVIQILVYYLLLTLLAFPTGKWLVWVLSPKAPKVGLQQQMNWWVYCLNLLTFSFVCFLGLLLLLKFQDLLPFNPQKFSGLSWGLAFNTAASFVSNTNWQAYGGETTMSILSQSVGLVVQNFISAAVGICVFAALARGLLNKENGMIGFFWQDLSRTTFLFLLPLSAILSVLLILQGVPQTLASAVPMTTYQNHDSANIPLGLVASQLAIKQLGTNGGGFYNVNSAHPFENPTPLSNLYQVLAILLIPAACCFAFGGLIKDKRQGIALYLTMLSVSLIATFSAVYCEQNPQLKNFPEQINYEIGDESPGGNMEGKEVRFGVTDSAIWAVATTAASNGSVNSMHDSFTPLGGLVLLIMMQVGEVIFGGAGSGLYGMLAFVIVTVFIAGLMIGRTPEYLGKKIEVFEMKMVSVVVLVPCILVLVGVSATIFSGLGTSSVSNPGSHGFSQILYAYSSMGNNNGSAFGGFASALPLHLWFGGIIMLLARFFVIIPTLALAGSLSVKKIVPQSAGTLPTHTVLFCTLLVGIILIVGALTFVPALVLGPKPKGYLYSK